MGGIATSNSGGLGLNIQIPSVLTGPGVYRGLLKSLQTINYDFLIAHVPFRYPRSLSLDAVTIESVIN